MLDHIQTHLDKMRGSSLVIMCVYIYIQVSIDSTIELFDAYLQVLNYSRSDEVSQYGSPTDKER